MISLIVAHNNKLIIGNKGTMPWHISRDLKYFKKITSGHTILMGRNTFESIGAKPLPNRENVVISSKMNFSDVVNFNSLDDALHIYKNKKELFIIGGATLYEQTLSIAGRLYVTLIHGVFKGDTYFPEYRHLIGDVFIEISREDYPECSFVVYERIR